MRIAYHLGAHFTDDERLLRCLLKNRDVLLQNEIVVPGPKRYRTLLRETATRLKGQAATIDEQALILEQIMEEDRADRLILSWDSFLSLPNYVLKDRLYHAAPVPTAAVRSPTPAIITNVVVKYLGRTVDRRCGQMFSVGCSAIHSTAAKGASTTATIASAATVQRSGTTACHPIRLFCLVNMGWA